MTARLEGVWAEEIYDATVDDEAFQRIAIGLADALGARSAVMHWRDVHNDTGEISYSGYFSEADMEVYEENFADADLWSAAVEQPDRINRVWNCDLLVPSGTYEQSRIYNEWIRPMGDDTFHAMGANIRTGTSEGVIGFHRGRFQPPFEDEHVRIVEGWLVHLRRMVSIRSKLAAASRDAASAAAGLNAIGYAVFTLGSSRKLLHCNQAAQALLQRDDVLTIRNQRLHARDVAGHRELQTAIRKGTASTAMEAAGLLLRRPSGGVYEVSIVSANTDGNRQTIVVISDPQARNSGLQARIRSIYGLTIAEAEVAARIAEGASPQMVAHDRAVSVSTVHSQLKTIFSKVGCSRQAELAALLSTFSRLHSSD